MRLSFLTLIALFFALTPALAEDSFLSRGYLPYEEKLPDPTDQQIDEALQVTITCKSNGYSRTYYDCDCTGMKFLELRQKNGDGPNATALLIEAQKSCPNAADVAGLSVQQCQSWAKLSRPYSYKEFCDCFASEYATLFERNTTENEMVREAQMTNAYTKCDGGKQLGSRLAKQSIIERLKENGIFKTLFPGASSPASGD